MIEVLRAMAENYQVLKPKALTGKINLRLDQELFHLEMTEDKVTAHPGAASGELAMFIMQRDTLDKLLDGTWTGLTAAGREHIRQSAPINFSLPPGAAPTPQFMQMVYHLGMHLFKTQLPHVYNFGPQHTRKIHGGNATALAYGPGVRFAYYTISGDEQINDEDTRDPMDQVLTVIGGKGIALIEGKEVELHKGVAVYVQPEATHVVRAKPGHVLELLWLAYGQGA